MGLIDNVASKFAAMTNQYVVGGGLGAIQDGGTKTGAINRYILNENSSVSYFNFLESYNFSASLISLFSSIAIEAIDNNELKVSLKNSNEETERSVNDIINSTNIKAKLIEDMPRIMWRGKYSYGIDPKSFNLIELKDPMSVKCVTRLGEVIGFVYNNSYFKLGEMVSYWYDRYPIVPMKTPKGLSDKLKSSGKETKLSKHYIEFATFTGKSIFSDQLMRLFQMYCLEYLIFMLSIREAIKPEMLSLTYGSKYGDLAYGTQASKQLESLLNAPTMGLANIIEPLSFVNKLTMSLLNYIKVIPNIDSYEGTRSIDMPDFTAKKMKASEDFENARRQILNNLTIPEDLYGGVANRWEAVGRNDRFMTTNQKIVGSISRFVKYYALAIIKNKLNIQSIKISDIEFNIDLTNFTSMYDVRNKIGAISDKVLTIDQLFGTVDQIINRYPWIDRKEFTEYVMKQVSAIDSDLGRSIIQQTLASPPPPPPAEDTDLDGIPNTHDPTPFGTLDNGMPRPEPTEKMRKEMMMRRGQIPK